MYILQLTSQMSSPPFQFFCLVPLLGSSSTKTPIELLVPPTVSVALQTSSGPGCLVIEVSKSHIDTSTHAHASTHAVGILWSSDQLVIEAATYITHNKLTDEHPCSQRNSKPRSQHSSGFRLTHLRAQPPASNGAAITVHNFSYLSSLLISNESELR